MDTTVGSLLTDLLRMPLWQLAGLVGLWSLIHAWSVRSERRAIEESVERQEEHKAKLARDREERRRVIYGE